MVRANMFPGITLPCFMMRYGNCSPIAHLHLDLNVPFSFVTVEQMSRHFELLNYSEHGTVVDNVVYCCDLDIDVTAKLEADSAKDRERNQSFQGLDDITRRSCDKMTTSLTDPNDVILLKWLLLISSNTKIDLWFCTPGFSLRLPYRCQLS